MCNVFASPKSYIRNLVQLFQIMSPVLSLFQLDKESFLFWDWRSLWILLFSFLSLRPSFSWKRLQSVHWEKRFEKRWATLRGQIVHLTSCPSHSLSRLCLRLPLFFLHHRFCTFPSSLHPSCVFALSGEQWLQCVCVLVCALLFSALPKLRSSSCSLQALL